MKLSLTDLRELADVAISAASDAGQMIAQSRPIDVQQKAHRGSLASQVVTEIDHRSERIIVDRLASTLQRFDLGLLTEERDDDTSRQIADYFWCIDPLDGTLPFVEGSHGYAVSIALVGRDGTPWIGVVYDPVQATLMHAISGIGAFRNRRRWATNPPASSQRTEKPMLSVFADRSLITRDDHHTLIEELELIAHDIGLAGLRLHTTAGAVMNACQVLTHPPACYFKPPTASGGGSLWDFAATACLFHEMGAIATNMHGGRLDLNRADSTFMNHKGVLFATDEMLAAEIRTRL